MSETDKSSIRSLSFIELQLIFSKLEPPYDFNAFPARTHRFYRLSGLYSSLTGPPSPKPHSQS